MITVVVPVHNTCKYIEECLNSILNQSYSDLEVICIDSSTDDTTQILRKIAACDSRVRVIEDSNSSYGYKVNTGIREANGEYISIVDSDDYLELNMYERLTDVMVENDADFVKSDYSSFIVENGKNKIIEYNDVLSDYSIYGKCVDIRNDFSILNKSGISIWTGLYKKRFICENNIYLNESEGASFQDAGFSILTHIYGRKIYYLHESFYRYRTDNINSSVKSQKKYRTIADEWGYIDSKVYSSGIQDEGLALALGIRKIMNYDWNYDRLEQETAEKFCESVSDELFEQYIKTGLFNKLEERHQKMFDRIYMNGKKEIQGDIIQIIDLLRNNKTMLVGSGEVWERISEYDVTNNIYSIQKYYDKEERVAKVGDFFVPVNKISAKMYEKDIIYIVTDNDWENIKKQLEVIGIKSDNIVICPYFYSINDVPDQDVEPCKPGEVKVSIIVPVYNVEKYLEQSLNSLIGQSMEEIEIICVNDGSTDSSQSILEAFSKKDKRVKVITQKNMGLAGARNTGLSYASGKYVMFCDSDDMFKFNTAQKMYNSAEENEADIVCCDAKCVYMNERLAREDNKDFYYQRGHSYGMDTGKEIFARMMENDNFCDSACLLLINREWLKENNQCFYTGILYEDCLFTVQCMMKAKKVYHTNEQFYIYRVREGSIMTSHMSHNNLYGRLIDLHYFNRMLCEEKLSQKQEWALTQFRRVVEYHAKSLVAGLDDREVDMLLEKPLTQTMLLELEKLGVSGNKIRMKALEVKLHDLINEVDNIEIYGAGIRGQRMLVYLQLCGYANKIADFVVTSNNTHNHAICGVEVEAVDEGWIPNNNNLVIVSFAGDEAATIVNKLRNDGLSHVLQLDGEFYQMVVDRIKKRIKM